MRIKKLSPEEWERIRNDPLAFINQPYILEPDEVFIKATDDGWTVAKRSEASDDQIIRCSRCHRPSVQLDHLYPYEVEHNRCEEHRHDAGTR